MYSYIHKALCMYTGQILTPENVSACVTYQDHDDTLLNVQWDVSVIYVVRHLFYSHLTIMYICITDRDFANFKECKLHY